MPAGRDEARSEVSQRGKDEQALGGLGMGDDQQASRLDGVGVGILGAPRFRPVDCQPGAAEDQQVEVELAWPPAPARLAAERPLDRLQADQQDRGPDLRIGTGRDVEGGDRVAELRLVGDPDRIGRVQPRDGDQARTGQGGQGMDGGTQRLGGVTQVGAEADIRPERSLRQFVLRHPYTRTVRPITVLIFHPQAGPGAGPLEGRLAAARDRLARLHEIGFIRAGATTVQLIAGPPDGLPFGTRLANALHDVPDGGLVILGSGAIPLASLVDRRLFVACAGGQGPMALTNNRFSSDILAVADVTWLQALPLDFVADNALPRWLAERAGVPVADLRTRQRLGVDLDSPLDLILLGRQGHAIDVGSHPEDSLVVDRLEGIRHVLADPAAELVVAGRTSAAALTWLEGFARCRVRALVEERGLRASSLQGSLPPAADRPQRPPRSLLGSILDRDGAAALGARLAELGDAALVDSRVLLAHRLGADESAWPVAEDRFSSDLLHADHVADSWLRELTRAAASAPIPVLLGGHSLVGPGIRLVAAG